MARSDSIGAGPPLSTAFTKASVSAALARDETFGYGRTRRVIRTLMPIDSDDRRREPSPSDLRALLRESADPCSARALVPIMLPAAFALDYAAPIARIRVLAETAPDVFFSLKNDLFVKDLAVCLGQLYPGGARLVDVRAGLPRRLLLWQRYATPAVLRFFWTVGGFAPWFETHVDPRDLSEFSESGLVRMYLRVAALLEVNPDVLGVFGGSWFYDPCLETLSPHLAYLQQLPRAHGARLFRGPTTPGTVASALSRSGRRRQAYESGAYRPQSYFLAWSRRAMLTWARARRDCVLTLLIVSAKVISLRVAKTRWVTANWPVPPQTHRTCPECTCPTGATRRGYNELPREVNMTKISATIRTIIAGLVLGASASGVAHAQVYDFKILGGGHSVPAITQVGSYICMDVKATANGVTFTFWSEIPEPYSRIVNVAFDTGRHADLFGNVAVVAQSPGVKMAKVAPTTHAYLPSFTPDYAFGRSDYKAGALGPGSYLLVSATLASGRSPGEVINALNEGTNPATAAAGLRIGVIVHHLLGKPLPTGTRKDDAGYAINAVSMRCRQR